MPVPGFYRDTAAGGKQTVAYTAPEVRAVTAPSAEWTANELSLFDQVSADVYPLDTFAGWNTGLLSGVLVTAPAGSNFSIVELFATLGPQDGDRRRLINRFFDLVGVWRYSGILGAWVPDGYIDFTKIPDITVLGTHAVSGSPVFYDWTVGGFTIRGAADASFAVSWSAPGLISAPLSMGNISAIQLTADIRDVASQASGSAGAVKFYLGSGVHFGVQHGNGTNAHYDLPFLRGNAPSSGDVLTIPRPAEPSPGYWRAYQIEAIRHSTVRAEAAGRIANYPEPGLTQGVTALGPTDVMDSLFSFGLVAYSGSAGTEIALTLAGLSVNIMEQ